MGLSRATKAILPEIEEACLTSRDDVGIAKYYHIPTYDVLTIRLMLMERATDVTIPRVSAVAKASSELRDATEKAIFKWGFRHGINRDQARVLLMDRRMP